MGGSLLTTEHPKIWGRAVICAWFVWFAESKVAYEEVNTGMWQASGFDQFWWVETCFITSHTRWNTSKGMGEMRPSNHTFLGPSQALIISYLPPSSLQQIGNEYGNVQSDWLMHEPSHHVQSNKCTHHMTCMCYLLSFPIQTPRFVCCVVRCHYQQTSPWSATVLCH